MNPYKQIAREHLTREDLEELLAEMEGPAPDPTDREEQLIKKYEEEFKASYRKPWAITSNTTLTSTISLPE